MSKYLNKESYIATLKFGELRDVAPLERVRILYYREKPAPEIRRVPVWNKR